MYVFHCEITCLCLFFLGHFGYGLLGDLEGGRVLTVTFLPHLKWVVNPQSYSRGISPISLWLQEGHYLGNADFGSTVLLSHYTFSTPLRALQAQFHLPSLGPQGTSTPPSLVHISRSGLEMLPQRLMQLKER